ncbi:branched-chain amino acid ABC transporter ATP-binding protein/permease [Hydrogenophaga pseudoflava]|uniref:branched-chain amino acid ABC transporter ATP-binding protein/permease n=1 Tax=Hydrogenophaga pseudoflava TaxID=47421 RepID=UPI0027E5246E|nr:ATP-binding cassette domain-containing protein [Hydrogenophaga pseudoflava]MDQ7747336.1 ATP-binding cassette domain-containing protein [Hydrogenophaga pseudoflava]
MALGIGLCALPFLTDEFTSYQIGLFLIYGIATQGVALCWGRLGFLPLGNALFFGLGAYLAGGSLKAASSNALWYATLPLALMLPAALAYLTARLVFARSSRSGPFFSLITLAMTMLGFLVVQQWSAVTGGFNGMSDIPEPPGMDRYADLYWVVAVCAVCSTLVLGVLIRRPIGTLWSAIAQNEDRLQLFGYATDRIKANAYALSALLAAAAGALFAMHQGIVTPLSMGVVLATEFIIWAAVGGKGSPLGALLGAVLVGYASSELRDAFSYWEVLVALLFLVVVRFLPAGLLGLVQGRHAHKDSGAEPVGKMLAPQSVPAGNLTLEFQNVSSSQGGVRILDRLSFALKGSGVRCIIGPNGAGKTSSFNVLTGRLPLRSGKILLNGKDVSRLPAWQVARHGVGRKMQVPSVFPDLTVSENLDIALWAGRLKGMDALGRSALSWHTPLLDDLLALFPVLKQQLNERAGSLSQGHRQALEFSMTMLPEPQLVLLDEPCAGLSPKETHQMIDAIKQVIERLGVGALVIEHDISAVEAIGGTVFVFDQGSLLAAGTLDDIQSDPSVKSVYAGARK